ncbi:uncharacterized protein [Ptychodera flava]|uniref:uncharacterized protein isoform X2 n=1 Tax=Ptychodera flava TaxID=63121 RepID=UPI003969F8AD
MEESGNMGCLKYIFQSNPPGSPLTKPGEQDVFDEDSEQYSPLTKTSTCKTETIWTAIEGVPGDITDRAHGSSADTYSVIFAAGDGSGSFDSAEETSSSTRVAITKLYEDHHDNKSNKRDEEETNDRIMRSMDDRIAECYVGRFTLNIENLKPPSVERKICELNLHQVSSISHSLLNDSGRHLELATPLVGMIDPKECRSKNYFNPDKLHDYHVEVIDGHHNFLAQKEALLVGKDAALNKREVCLYVGLTNKECRRLCVKRNLLTSNHLPMSDWDYITLMRDAIKKEFKDGHMPGRDMRSNKFWKRLYAMLGFKYEKKVLDAKRPIQSLARLPDREFGIVKKIFERKPSLKATAITKGLQGIKSKDERLKLLKSFLVSKKEFQQASIRAKGSDINVRIEDDWFCVLQGGQRIQGANMILSCGDVMYKMTPNRARELVRSEGDGKRKEKIATECDGQKKTKKRKPSVIHELSDTAESEEGRQSKLARKCTGDQRTSRDHGGAGPSSLCNVMETEACDTRLRNTEENKKRRHFKIQYRISEDQSSSWSKVGVTIKFK